MGKKPRTDTYTLCKHCDHFVEENPSREGDPNLAKYIHLDDGDSEYTHNAEPSGDTRSIDRWKKERPDLFMSDEDGVVGPNSLSHVHLGPGWTLRVFGDAHGRPKFKAIQQERTK